MDIYHITIYTILQRCLYILTSNSIGSIKVSNIVYLVYIQRNLTLCSTTKYMTTPRKQSRNYATVQYIWSWDHPHETGPNQKWVCVCVYVVCTYGKRVGVRERVENAYARVSVTTTIHTRTYTYRGVRWLGWQTCQIHTPHNNNIIPPRRVDVTDRNLPRLCKSLRHAFSRPYDIIFSLAAMVVNTKRRL